MGSTAFTVPALMLVGFSLVCCIESGARALRPAKEFAHPATMPVLYGVCIAAIALAFFVFELPYFRPYAFADDWVFAQPLGFHSLDQWRQWLFVQHVDHRIPIQKLISYAALRLTGFDFRYVVGINYAMAIGVSTMLLWVAKAYRGFLSAGDMIIPLAMLQFSTGFSLWGFQFQFISSIFFFALFVFLSARGRVRWGAVALMADALCGMNGLMFAAVGTVGMFGWMIYARDRRGVAVYLLAAALELWIGLAWKPTAASSTSGLNLLTVVEYMRGLLPSSMGVYSFGGASGKAAGVLALLIAAGFVIVGKLIRKELKLIDYLLILGAGASFVVMAAVAVGRAKQQGEWSSGVAMHYGSMSVFMPVMAWLIVSKRFQRAGVVIGIALLCVYLLAFMRDVEWRASMNAEHYPKDGQVLKDLQSDADVGDVAEKHILAFTIDEAHKKDVTQGIAAFRAAGASLYGH